MCCASGIVIRVIEVTFLPFKEEFVSVHKWNVMIKMW